MQPYHLVATGFEAARQLPGAADHRLHGWHGHSFKLGVRCEPHHIDGDRLAAALAEAIAPFDYRALNDTLATPDDLTLAQHLAAKLPCPVSLALQGAPEHGILLGEQGEALLWFDTGFEAAHHLPHVPPGHKCGRLHGHGFGVRLVVQADRTDLATVQAAWAPLQQALHHQYLNTIDGLANPTSEMLAYWLYQQLSATLPALAWVEVRETHTAGSQYDGKLFRIWKEQRFESAVPFDEHGRYTGHSYRIRLMLAGALDKTMGWLLDFGDVKSRFKPLYKQLDHNPLDTLPGLRDTSLFGVAEWVHSELTPLVPELARVDLWRNDEAGVSVAFHDGMRWPWTH
jgi:6-pyruvoyltetrahydropterin/6-carboxytetrahydropterin synthase